MAAISASKCCCVKRYCQKRSLLRLYILCKKFFNTESFSNFTNVSHRVLILYLRNNTKKRCHSKTDRMKTDEDKIILLLKQGDTSAYKYIYDHYYTFLCAISGEYLKDNFLAETIVGDLIFHLWEKRDTLEITISLRSYLIRAVRNRSINHLNLERERKELAFSSINETQQNKLHYSESLEYPLTTLLENELEKEIMQAINNLPPDCRRVFEMSRWEGKRYEQIALELGISINTVKYHIKNALARLSTELSKYLLWFFF